jgi:two-component system CheB/CheR fusion protein
MSANQGRILLVEDHADTARVFSTLLSQDGFDVTVAGTLAEGLKACETGSFDLLVCDVRLPDGDGIELLFKVREHCPDVAGIVVSGYDETEIRAAAKAAGFLEYLLKPLTYAELRDAVIRSMPGANPAALSS